GPAEEVRSQVGVGIGRYRVQDDQTVGQALHESGAQLQVAAHRLFHLHGPVDAARREVAVDRFLKNEGVTDLRLAERVQVQERTCRDVSVRVVIRDQLVRILVEHVDVEGHTIVEEAEASAHRRAPAGYWIPGQSRSRRDAKGSGD